MTFYKNIFLCSGLEDLESLHTEFHDQNEGDFEVTDKHILSLMHLYEQFLRYPMYKAATYVLLWKLFSMISTEPGRDQKYYFDLIDDELIPFLTAHVDSKANIARYEQFKKELAFHSNRLRFEQYFFLCLIFTG